MSEIINDLITADQTDREGDAGIGLWSTSSSAQTKVRNERIVNKRSET